MKFVWYSILTLTLFGCCPKGRFSGDIVGHPDFGSECNMLNKDENGEIVKNGIVVIRNPTEYARWKLSIESNSKSNCSNCEFPALDFGKVTLIITSFGRANCDYELGDNVSIDHRNKKCIVTTTILCAKDCESEAIYLGSLLIPKIPEDYAVSYEIKNR